MSRLLRMPLRWFCGEKSLPKWKAMMLEHTFKLDSEQLQMQKQLKPELLISFLVKNQTNMPLGDLLFGLRYFDSNSSRVDYSYLCQEIMRRKDSLADIKTEVLGYQKFLSALLSERSSEVVEKLVQRLRKELISRTGSLTPSELEYSLEELLLEASPAEVKLICQQYCRQCLTEYDFKLYDQAKEFFSDNNKLAQSLLRLRNKLAIRKAIGNDKFQDQELLQGFRSYFEELIRGATPLPVLVQKCKWNYLLPSFRDLPFRSEIVGLLAQLLQKIFFVEQNYGANMPAQAELGKLVSYLNTNASGQERTLLLPLMPDIFYYCSKNKSVSLLQLCRKMRFVSPDLIAFFRLLLKDGTQKIECNKEQEEWQCMMGELMLLGVPERFLQFNKKPTELQQHIRSTLENNLRLGAAQFRSSVSVVQYEHFYVEEEVRPKEFSERMEEKARLRNFKKVLRVGEVDPVKLEEVLAALIFLDNPHYVLPSLDPLSFQVTPLMWLALKYLLCINPRFLADNQSLKVALAQRKFRLQPCAMKESLRSTKPPEWAQDIEQNGFPLDFGHSLQKRGIIVARDELLLQGIQGGVAAQLQLLLNFWTKNGWSVTLAKDPSANPFQACK